MCWLLSQNVGGALVSDYVFQERGQKDLFWHYYQKALLDAYLMPFLSNL